MKLRQYKGLIVAGFVMLAFLWIAYSSISLQCCIQQTADYQSGNLLKEISAYFSFHCFGKWLVLNRDNIIAFSTLVIAIFTATLWGATSEQARLTTASLKLATNEFIATQRPKLRIRNITIDFPSSAHQDRGRYFGENCVVHGNLWVVNIGNTNATVISSHCMVYWRQGNLPMDRPYEGDTGNQFMKNVLLAPGEDQLGAFYTLEALGPEGNEIQLSREKWKLWVMGWVEYADDRSPPVIRKSSFCHQWMPEAQHFWAVDHPDYQQED